MNNAISCMKSVYEELAYTEDLLGHQRNIKDLLLT